MPSPQDVTVSNLKQYVWCSEDSDQGEGVGVYPEGERSWDANLQPFRRGTIRLLLKAGVPIIPTGVVGSYDVWPRWSRTIRRRRVKVTSVSPSSGRPCIGVASERPSSRKPRNHTGRFGRLSAVGTDWVDDSREGFVWRSAGWKAGVAGKCRQRGGAGDVSCSISFCYFT